MVIKILKRISGDFHELSSGLNAKGALKILLPGILLGSIMFLSCNMESNKSDTPEITGEKEAYFDFFTYEGKDDFYAENPLPGESYYYNPILPGWYSDPSICKNGNDYFMVMSTFSYFPGVPLFHSNDLVNWEQVGHVLDRESQLQLNGQHTSGGIFAPAISYNPHNETYYMITTNVGAGNFYVTTKDPFGSWSDPVWLRDVGGIDPSIFFDEDGKAYILNNDAPEGTPRYDGHRAVWIREFDWKNEKTVGEAKVLIDGGIHPEENPVWIEGPHMYNIDGNYYVMCAEGGTSVQHSEVILRGDHPMGDFTAWEENPILTQRHLDPERPNPITCAGHADLIQAEEGDWWAVFLACRPIDHEFENLGRETFLLPVKWSEDGWPYITRGDEEIAMMEKREGITRDEDVTFGNFTKEDDFNADTLSYEWITLRTDASEHYSLTENDGFLTLECSDSTTTGRGTPAYIGRRMQHHKFTVTTKMFFEPETEGGQAGVLLYKDERHQYFMAVGKPGEDRTISLKKITTDGEEILAEEPIKSTGPVKMQVNSLGTHYDFYYAIGDGEMTLLVDNVDARYLSTANSWGFTGTTIGMYAIK